MRVTPRSVSFHGEDPAVKYGWRGRLLVTGTGELVPLGRRVIYNRMTIE